MAIKLLTQSQIHELVQTTHPKVGLTYPPAGMVPYYQWLMQTLHELAQTAAADLHVSLSDQADTQVRIAPGRGSIDGAAIQLEAQTVNLATYNNDQALLWVELDGSDPAIGHATQATGWPAGSHLKLATVTLDAGKITDVADMRFVDVLTAGLADQAVKAQHLNDDLHSRWVRYGFSIHAQGDTSTPSVVRIRKQDPRGNDLTSTGVLRVRVCDQAGWTDATDATIAVTGDTTIAQTVTAGTDLVLLSSTAGLWEIALTNATAQTVTLRIGPALLGGDDADYSPHLDVTHA